MHPNFIPFVESFCSKESLREQLRKPTCYDNGLVFASDGHILVTFYDEKYHENNPNSFKFDKNKGEGVDAFAVIEPMMKYLNDHNHEPIGYIDLADFKSVFDSIKMIPEYNKKYKDCEECDGFGEVTCDYCGHGHECEECDGEGEIEVPSDEVGYYKLPSNEDECFTINEVPFGLNIINKLCECLNLVDCKQVNVYGITNDRAYLGVNVDGIRCFIIVMGLNRNNQDKFHKIQINLLNSN